ncbi:MAG TPA: DUF4350 domain-containing protein [Acidobacteriaceae bacterium]|jgi:hypothetical protein|nr:DUF4350 domain-containing protein [Acidobacteriaceae bacterium]
MKKPGGDWRFLLGFTAVVLGLIVVTGILAPDREDRNPVPTTWNSGAAGAKAAWLLLAQLGYNEVRWERPESELSSIDAAHATLVLAEPSPSLTAFSDKTRKQPFIDFLHRGGRILATGSLSAILLPDAAVSTSDRLYTELCFTTPDGPGSLASAGEVEMAARVRWNRNDPSVRVEQLCGSDPVVVSYAVGRGQIIWWASATPLTNRGLHNDGNLRLLLASVGATDRTVYFDEYLHGINASPWTTTRGTPLTGILIQIGCIAALLLFSFARGSGPHRALVQPPRASPLEFVESMGALYAKAGVGSVAVAAAQRRFSAFLSTQAGIPAETLRSGPAAIAAAVQVRLNCDTTALAADLEAAQQALYEPPSAATALVLVRRLDQHIANLTEQIRKPQDNRGKAQRIA